ncbi:MAG: hypothetical protein ACK6BG_09260 [Cyanobacteriota bacterium]|jgi:hypothetical protein
MNLFAKKATVALAWATLAGAASAGMTLGVAAPARAITPGLTVTTPLGASWASNPSSFGFFFDTTSNISIDALGLGFQNNWSSVTSNYTVTLWSFVAGGAAASNYTPIVSSVFNGGQTYTLQDGYWWKGITPILLPNTSNLVDPTSQLGYVVTAIGDFSGGASTLKFESGTPTISQYISLLGNGYNSSGSGPGASYWPIPILYSSAVGNNGYFNPNLSFVPGPLPVLGVASAFSFSRRMRRRIKATNQA